MTEPFSHSLFCDDIRHERDGKYTLVGVYDRICTLPQFPAVIPRLAIAVWVAFPSTKAINRIICRLLLNEIELGQAKLLAPEGENNIRFPPIAANGGVNSPDVRNIAGGTACTFFELSPLLIERPGILKVEVRLNDDPALDSDFLMFERQSIPPVPEAN